MADEREAPARILIVDDHRDNVEVLRARLEAWGFETESAMDGAQALKHVEASPPDLILLDVMMPSIDDDYITKPIEFPELKARLRSMLRIKRLQEELEERERQLLEANERLRHMSQTDGLTGLDNRRYLEQQLDAMFAHAERLNEPLSCVMCDLDRFKWVNDTHGHQAGDAVLKQLARILKVEARDKVDRVGRYGGEEFMLLLPGTVLDAAVTFSERVRKAVETRTFTFDGSMLKRTASFGVAGWPHPRIPNCDALVRAADDALYVAKETGRNRVVRFDSDEFNAHTSASYDPAQFADGSHQHSARPGVADDGGLRAG
jgi:diguanylate cyclase (GGDEF)-like protein